MATEAQPDDTKPNETRPKKKDKRPEPTDWTKTFWALVIPVVTALIAATGAVIVGFLNAPKPQDGGAHPVINNIVTYLRVGTYLGAKSLLEATATPAIVSSQQGDRLGQLAVHLSFLPGSEWSAGSSGTNRLITFAMMLKATPSSASTNGAVTFVLKRGDRTVCTAVLNTQTAYKDSGTSWIRAACADEVAAGLDPRYTADIKNSNVSMSDVFAENIYATKF